MSVLSNQRKGSGTSRYNFKDDLMWAMVAIEDCIVAGDRESVYLEGGLDRATMNRIREALGMEPLVMSRSHT